MIGDHDTIAAIGTARGVGALGIVRISGSRTAEIVSRCFPEKSVNFEESHRAYYGIWRNPDTNAAVDEVVLLIFAEGRGYSGELSAEVICHGGTQVTELVLKAALNAGARLARPGEFTYRAVMNNKLDLARAESVLEIIRAKTPRAVANALNNIRGALSEKLEKIESDIIYVLAHLEASIDFTTEDIQPVDFSEMRALTEQIRLEVENLLKTYVECRLADQGLRVVLAGRPNSGKSSLLNGLVGKHRSIVDDGPGTTRDTIEEEILIENHLFRLVDTAGLRAAENKIEKLGIERAREEIKGADLVVFVIDSAVGISDEDLEQIRQAGIERSLVAFNKSDLKEVAAEQIMRAVGLAEVPALRSSTVIDGGLEHLRKAMVKLAVRNGDSETRGMISTERQRQGLQNASGKLKSSESLLSGGASPEFVSSELKDALLCIQEVLGKTPGDDVMDRVFKEFCIGK